MMKIRMEFAETNRKRERERERERETERAKERERESVRKREREKERQRGRERKKEIEVDGHNVYRCECHIFQIQKGIQYLGSRGYTRVPLHPRTLPSSFSILIQYH